MTDLPRGFRLRAATAADHAALQDICLKTGDSGQDGTHLQDDPTLLGLAYAVPYQVFAPDFAFLLEDALGPCGYLFGVTDTRAFEDWLERAWYPPLRARLQDPGPDSRLWKGSDWVRRRILAPERTDEGILLAYPAHGHIDLLPRARGLGLGRTMMEHLADCLRRAGAPGLFLDVGLRNTAAQAFYRRIGFHVLAEGPGAVVMARRL